MAQVRDSTDRPEQGSLLAMRRRGKYNVSAKKDRTYNGITFDSRREMKRYMELELLEKAGVIEHLQCQITYEVIPKYGKERAAHYIADFVYTDENGHTVIEDAKGVKTPEYVLKRKLMNWLHKIQVREV